MFSPKVLYKLPCTDRTLMTLFVNRFDEDGPSIGSWAEIMNCSFRTSYTPSALKHPNRTRISTHQHPDNRIMIWIGNIVREILYDVKKTANEIVVHEHCINPLSVTHSSCLETPAVHTQILNLHPLNPRHLV